MSADLRDQLQTTLGATYSVERELTGGGMSRVFVAEEVALGRRVVVKVLQPDLAGGLNVDRFRREIRVAAQLQHANIVPLLTAGEVDGLPYFTMPFVAGESLRQRLMREGELPVTDAVKIVHDVAMALAHAHRHGIIHRDIKPENILFSDDVPLVTDFGVAKALDAAATSASSITSIGVVVGTPAYMAPEQAAGDAATDHRADLYALGVVAYELLVGETPFRAESPQQMMSAHIAKAPDAVGNRRPSMPAPLADLVMRCLEKRPADRPQTAREIVQELDRIATSAHPSVASSNVGDAAPVSAPETSAAGASKLRGLFPRPARSRWLGAAVVGLVGIIAILRAAEIWPSGPSESERIAARRSIIIADFDAPSTDTLLGTVVSDALRTDLSQSPRVAVTPPATIQQTLARMQLPRSVRIDREVANEIATREGIDLIVDGRVIPQGRGYILSSQVYSPGGSGTLIATRANARDAGDVIAAIGRLSQALRKGLGESRQSVSRTPPLDRVTTASLPALRSFAAGRRALNRDGDYAKALAHFETAVGHDSTFATAWAGIATTLFNSGGPLTRTVDATRRAYKLRARMTDYERSMTEGDYFYFVADQPDKAIAAYEAAAEAESNSWEPLNMLALVHSGRQDNRRSAEVLRRALATPNPGVVVYSNLTRALTRLGNLSEAKRTLDSGLVRFPTHPSLHVVRWALAFAEGKYDSANAYALQLENLRRGDLATRARAIARRAMVARLRGRLAEAERLVVQAAELDRERGRLEAPLEAALAPAWHDAWYRGQRMRVRAQVSRALATYPIDSIPPLDRPLLTIARILAEANEPERVSGILTEMQRTLSPERYKEIAPQRHEILGRVALLKRRPDEALAEFRRSSEQVCIVCALPNIARAHDLAGRADSARLAYERYVTTVDYSRWLSDPDFLPRSLSRLAELHEARGDRGQAASYYAKFVELWKHADRELQPEVTRARQKLETLSRNGRGGAAPKS